MTDLHKRATDLLALEADFKTPLRVTRHFSGPSPEDEGEGTVVASEAEYIHETLLEALALIRDYQADRDAAIKAAVEKEREACAALIEGFTQAQHVAIDIKSGVFPSQSPKREAMAATIRARGDKP